MSSSCRISETTLTLLCCCSDHLHHHHGNSSSRSSFDFHSVGASCNVGAIIYHAINRLDSTEDTRAFGFFRALLDTENFIAEQYPSLSHVHTLAPSPNAQIIAMQLGNTYLLLGLLGFYILNTTTEARVVRAYVTILAFADLGHMAPTLWVLGWSRAVNVANWNSMTWGNIGASLVLFISRIAYLMGWLGKDKTVAKTKAL